MLDLFTHFAALNIPYGLEWEIILADNASTDGTAEWVKELNQNYDWQLNFKIIKEEKPGLNHAREAGARAAKYDWILFCDDDNWLDPDYVFHWYNVVNNCPDVGAVGGQARLGDLDDVPLWVSKYGHSYALGPQANHTGYLPKGAALYGAGLFIKKSPVLDMLDNGFKWVMTDRKGNSLSSGGDLEWCYLLQLNGYKLYFEEQMTFVHAIKPDRFNWSYYLKLKRGIASGVALLEPYRFLLLHGTTTMNFFIFLLSKFLLAQFIFTKQFLLQLFRSAVRSNDEQQLGLIIVDAKARSYRSSFYNALKHFRFLKKFKVVHL